MKCAVCKVETKKMLGVSGAYDKEWYYCKEHYREVKVLRDNFLVKNKLPVYDKVPYHEEIVKEYYEAQKVEG